MRIFRILLAATALATVASANALNIVLNPGFETGDFTNWSATPAATSAVSALDPHSGTFEASFSPLATGGVGTSLLTQALTTTPNTLYNVSFYLKNAGTAPGGFVTLLGGSQIFNVPTATSGGYQFYSTTFSSTAGMTSALLSFTFTTPAGALFRLDDVTVEAVPEPAPFAALGVGALGLLRRRRKA